MRPAEIRALSAADLAKQLEEAHRELFNLRFRLKTRQLSNPRELGKVRRNIARMETVLRERELAGPSSSGGTGTSAGPVGPQAPAADEADKA